MPLASPKPSTFDPPKGIQFVINPATGVIATAFPQPAPPAPAANPPAVAAGPEQSAEPLAPEQGPLTPEDQILQDLAGQGLFPSEESVGPVPGGVELPTGEEILQQRTAEDFVPGRFGQKFTESEWEREIIEFGNVGAVFDVNFGGSISGFMGFSELPPEMSDELEARAANYADRAPIRAVSAALLSRFYGDAPVDLLLMTGGGAFGVVLDVLSKARVVKSISWIRDMKRVRDAISRAKAGPLKGSIIAHAVTDGLYGVATEVSIEATLQSMGRAGDDMDIIKMGLMGGMLSPVFGFALRTGAKLTGKAFKSARKTFIDKSSDQLAEDTGLPKKVFEDAYDEGLPRTDAEAKARMDEYQQRTGEGPARAPEPEAPARDVLRKKDTQTASESVATKPRDVDMPSSVKAFESPAMRKAADDFNAKPTKGRLRKWLDEALEPAERVNSGKILDAIEMRAKSSGMTFKNYLIAKGLRVDTGEVLSVLSREGSMLLNAPAKAANVSDLLHEVGHIIRSDLGGRHLSDLEARYGVERGGIWNREQEELFANDVRDFLEGHTGFPRQVRRAIQAFMDTVEKVYRKLFGMDAKVSKNEVFAQLFSEAEGLGIHVPSVVKELKVAQQRIEAGVTELRATGAVPTPARGEAPGDRKKEIENAEARNIASQEKIAAGAADSIEVGDFTPKTRGAKTWNKIKGTTRLLRSDNVDLVGVLNTMGSVGKAIRKKFFVAAESSAKIVDTSMTKYNKVLDDADIDNDYLVGLYNTKSEATIGGVKINKPQAWWLQKTLEAMDGWNKEKNFHTEFSGRAKLLELGFKLEGRKEAVKVSQDQLEFLATGGRFKDDKKFMALVGAIQETRRTAGLQVQDIVRKLTGKDFLNFQNHFFTNLHTEKGIEIDGIFENINPDITRKTGRKAFHVREGNAALADNVDPINDMMAYLRYVSETASYAESHKDLTVFLDAGRSQIKAVGGRSMVDSLDDLANILGGDRSILGVTDDQVFSKIYSLTIISQLGANPSVMLKQFSSAWTAAAIQKLKVDGKFVRGKELIAEATKIVSNKKLREQGRAEMDQHSSWAKLRRESRVRWVEIEDIIGNLGVFERKGKLSVKELIKITKKKGITKFDTQLAVLEKTTEGIQLFDEGMMQAIWKSSKLQFEPSSNTYWKDVNKLFIEIAMESQPTRDIVSKSMNQMKRGFVNKALVQYTTQTRKIASIANQAVTRYLNITNPSKADRAELFNAMVPLMIQTGYAAAVGTLVGTGVAAFKDQFKTERQRQALEKRREGMMAKFVGNMIQGTFGITPIVGPAGAGLLNALLGNKPYAQGIPGLSQLDKIKEGIFQRNLTKGLSGTAELGGIPSIFAVPVATTLGNLTK